MDRTRGIGRKLLLGATLLGLVALLMLAGVASAFAAGGSGNGLQWRNEGFSTAKTWTTGEIGPYSEGDLVPFRLTVTNSGKTSATVGGFSLEVTAFNHNCAIFDFTTNWTGPIAPDSKDGLAGDMLRTTFPAGLTLAPGASATFSFMGHLANTATGHPAAGMLNGNGVVGFSKVDAAGVGAAGKDVPVKVNSHAGTLGTPAINIVKSSDAPTTGVTPGTMVNYSFVVKNIGDVALYDAHVTDDILGDIGTVVGPLAPGASATLSFSAVANETFTSFGTVLASDALGRPATASSSLTITVSTSVRIFGSAFEDLNANGAWDAGEPVMAVCPILLWDDQGNVLSFGETDATGTYEFNGLTPGNTYIVTQPVGGSWYGTAPADGQYTIVPATGEDCGPYDFGATQDGGV